MTLTWSQLQRLVILVVSMSTSKALSLPRSPSIDHESRILKAAGSDSQSPLAESPSPSTTTLEIQDVDGWLYTTDISIGEPPLMYRAAIDTCWSDLFLPSVQCLERDRPEYCASHPLYNSTASSTYSPIDGREVAVARGGYYTRGNAAMEKLQLGHLQIHSQAFEEAYQFRPTYLLDDTTYDTVLGLSRRTVQSEDSDLRVASPFQNLVSQGRLERNIFSLSLPRTTEERGRLTLGGVDLDLDDSSADATTLPLSDSTLDTSGGWEVGAVNLTFGSGSNVIHQTLPSYVAILSTANPMLELPEDFVRAVQKRVGASIYDGTIDCDKVPSLPNLTISLKALGESIQDLILTPEQYTGNDLKLPVYDPDRCLVLLAPPEDKGKAGQKSIVLGARFLKHFHAIFDADERTVSLTPRSD